MINTKDHNQTTFFDPWDHLGPKRRKLLDTNWPGLFKNIILPKLPVHKLAASFSANQGRPTKELYTCLGVVLLQNMLDLTDEETIDRLAFDISWHYALNLPEESDAAKYLSIKTLYNVRQIVINNDLCDILFKDIVSVLKEAFKVNTDKQRLDSVHIKSNMRNLGRIGLFVSVIKKFLVNLKRNYKEEYDKLSKELKQKYLKKESDSCFAMVKPSESRKTLKSVADDLFDLFISFKGRKEIESMYAYKLIIRILKEQCNIAESIDGKKLELKPAKEIPGDSLQNPSDPDATYSGHKGQGYRAQVMETYCTDKEKKSRTLNLITYIKIEQAHKSDTNALIPAVKDVKERDLKPKDILADQSYGSDDNCMASKKERVNITSPVKSSSNKDNKSLSDFDMDKKGNIIACPCGNKPIKVNKKKRFSVHFDLDVCSKCERVSKCRVEEGKKYFYLRYTKKDARIALRRQYEETYKFKDRYRWRSGIEAAFSELNRRTGIKHLRIRGLRSVRFACVLKVVGLNILRAAAVLKARLKALLEGKYHNEYTFSSILSVKELLKLIFSCLRKKLTQFYLFFKSLRFVTA